MAEKRKNLLPTRRKLIQLYAALLYNAHLKGFITGEIYTGKLKAVCTPGLNCYSCPGAVGACPLGALQNAVASSGNRAPTYMLGILLLYGLIAGRTICGWACPFGLIQELLHKIPSPKLKKSRVTKALSYLKYVILAVFAALIPFLMREELPLPAFCKYICPAGTFEGALALISHPKNAQLRDMLGILFTRKLIILIAVLAACVFVYRSFCRFLCPLGAIYGFFSRITLLGVKVEKSACTDCGACVARCPMDISRVGDHECIHCASCVSICPTGAIRFKAGNKTLVKKKQKGREQEADKPLFAGRLAAVAAVLVLAGVLLAVNLPEGKSETTDSVAAGHEVGQRVPDFTMDCVDGRTFSLSANRGKVVVLNLWATWCGPCVKELPYFEELYEKYPEEAAVLAIHSDLITDDVSEWLSGKDYTMPFAVDNGGEVIASLGGSTMLPQTIILDQEGIVVYNAVGSMDAEKLMEQIAPLWK